MKNEDVLNLISITSNVTHSKSLQTESCFDKIFLETLHGLIKGKTTAIMLFVFD